MLSKAKFDIATHVLTRNLLEANDFDNLFIFYDGKFKLWDRMQQYVYSCCGCIAISLLLGAKYFKIDRFAFACHEHCFDTS